MGILKQMFDRAMALNRAHLLRAAKASGASTLVDLGCDDGAWTAQLLKASGAKVACGVEIVPERAALAREKGMDVHTSDLEVALPFKDQSFDLVHANQVIEHVKDVDHFAQECHRILKPGGTILISTENGSSWHNIFAAAMGWQIFSLTNMSSRRAGVGNPMALLRGQSIPHQSWTHRTIFNYRGLKEFFELHGFTDVRIRGAGYYPLPAYVGALDPRHAHFLTLVAKKGPQ